MNALLRRGNNSDKTSQNNANAANGAAGSAGVDANGQPVELEKHFGLENFGNTWLATVHAQLPMRALTLSLCIPSDGIGHFLRNAAMPTRFCKRSTSASRSESSWNYLRYTMPTMPWWKRRNRLPTVALRRLSFKKRYPNLRMQGRANPSLRDTEKPSLA
jgi:hypothetical protein